MKTAPIGIFDSGYGGLTVLREIVTLLPSYDYLYLGDNARSPYGPRDFDTIYHYTLECVQYLFGQGCPLIILACNTASAKALRNIQQLALPKIAPDRRVLGVIRPTAEVIGNFSKTKKVGVLGTVGTVRSESYLMEIGKFFPEVEVTQQACPMWVPLVENGELAGAGTDFFVKKYLDELLVKSPDVDTLLLACTHYPLLEPVIRQFLPKEIKVISQGEIVAKSLVDYLRRHPEMAERCSKNGHRAFHTTGSAEDFDGHASAFFGEEVKSIHAVVAHF
ncbi:MAG: glutamate racemase [Saprospiraceae bacterium]|nr:glutamate racemase [Saprospiraceae bacterium]MCF8251017.1 glutamate racemase [Saprospiraceae bacterium]MCF8281473.1 glutamate racemase [Bacteroidales bacterium]MCF8311614.1 glutamate racemase [Saprospiraceae bacterium]MCF8440955.1 glutamate racemase [Saprospiraceae bacterium]